MLYVPRCCGLYHVAALWYSQLRCGVPHCWWCQIEHFVRTREAMRERRLDAESDAARPPDAYIVTDYARGRAGLRVLLESDSRKVLQCVRNLQAKDLCQPGRALRTALEAVHYVRVAAGVLVIHPRSPALMHTTCVTRANCAVRVVRDGHSTA